MKILLVEDDPTLGEAVVLATRQAGFAIDWTRDGAQAETALSGFAYDAMLLDLGLPRREGLEVLEILLHYAERVTAKEAIADRLAGWDEGVGENAVEVYIHRLRRKLEGSGVGICTLRGLGYLLEVEP